MKGYYKYFFFLGFLHSSAQAVVEHYTLDPNHTYVLWQANHFGFSHPSGKWLANGTLEFDPETPTNSKTNVIIKIEELNTGIPEFDKHLKGKQFLDVDKFPTATFESNKIEADGSDAFKIFGTLNLHGVSKPIILNAKLNKMGKSPVNDKDTIGFSANTNLKRSDFGITSALPGVGDDIKIELELEANKK